MCPLDGSGESPYVQAETDLIFAVAVALRRGGYYGRANDRIVQEHVKTPRLLRPSSAHDVVGDDAPRSQEQFNLCEHQPIGADADEIDLVTMCLNLLVYRLAGASLHGKLHGLRNDEPVDFHGASYELLEAFHDRSP